MARNNQNRNNNRNDNQDNNQNSNRNNNNISNNNNQNNNQNRNNKQKNNRKNNNNNNNSNQNKANGKPCLNCYKPGHFQNECTAECGNCGLRGHTRNHCPRPSKKHESAKPYCIDCNQSNHSTEACTRCKYCDSSTHKTSACTKEYKKRNWEDGAVKCGNCEVIGHAAGSCRNPNSNRGWEKDEDGNPVAPDYLPPNFHKQPPPAAQPLFFNPQAIAPHCERCESHGVPAILSFHDHKTCQNLRYCRFCNLTTHNDDQCINAAAQDSYKRAAGAPCARCNSMGHNFVECLHWNPGEDLTILHVHNESILALDGWVLNYKLELWGFKKPRDDIYTSMVNNVCIGLHYLYVPAIVELSKKGFTLRCRRCATKATLHDSMSEDTVMGSCEADVISVAPQKNDEAMLRIDCDCFLAEGMVWNRIAPPQLARLDKSANPWHGN